MSTRQIKIAAVFLLLMCGIAISEEKIPARKSHSAIYDPVGKKMLIFGGAGKEGLLSDTWVFDIEKKVWQKIEVKHSPSARWGHSAIYDESNKQMLIFGGYAEKGGSLSDVWAFNIENKEWKKIKIKETPPARHGHSAIYDPVNKQMIIFGGKGNKPLGDTWTFGIEKRSWEEIAANKESPPPSFGHSAIYDSANKKMVIFIGTATWIYDIEPLQDNSPTGLSVPKASLKKEWTEKSGIFEISAFSFSAVYDSANKQMIIFGSGIQGSLLADTWIADIEKDEWNKVDIEKVPAGRTRHSVIYDSKNKQMIIFGGTNRNEILSDIWAFDIEKKEWKEIIVEE